MIRPAKRIYCDQEHGTGDVAFPDLDAVNWIDGPATAATLRREARKLGWRRIMGADYCPDCVACISERGLDD